MEEETNVPSNSLVYSTHPMVKKLSIEIFEKFQGAIFSSVPKTAAFNGIKDCWNFRVCCLICNAELPVSAYGRTNMSLEKSYPLNFNKLTRHLKMD